MAGIIVKKDNTRFYLWEAAGEVTAADKIGSATEFGESGFDTDEQDVTTIESEAVETEPGDEDYGSQTVTQNLTAAELTKMVALKGKKLKYACVIENSAGTIVHKETAPCWIKSIKRGALQRNGTVTVSTELRITGPIDYDTFVEPAAG